MRSSARNTCDSLLKLLVFVTSHLRSLPQWQSRDVRKNRIPESRKGGNLCIQSYTLMSTRNFFENGCVSTFMFSSWSANCRIFDFRVYGTFGHPWGEWQTLWQLESPNFRKDADRELLAKAESENQLRRRYLHQVTHVYSKWRQMIEKWWGTRTKITIKFGGIFQKSTQLWDLLDKLRERGDTQFLQQGRFLKFIVLMRY